MKTVTLGLVIVAVVVLAIGLASSGPRVDVDFIIGTWHHASLTAIAAIVAGLLLVCGLAAAVIAVLGQAADRRALEEELQRTYMRLREAEGPTQARTPAAVELSALPGSAAGTVSPGATTAATAISPAVAAPAAPGAGRPPVVDPAPAPSPPASEPAESRALTAEPAEPAEPTEPTEPTGPLPAGGDDES